MANIGGMHAPRLYLIPGQDAAAALHEIEVGVNWADGRRRRAVVLHSVVEVYTP